MKSAYALPVRLGAALVMLGLSAGAVADTAKMLPEGNFRLRYQFTQGWADSQFDDSGSERSFSDLNDTRLAEAGLSPSVASVYRIDSDGKSTFSRHDVYFEYGLTDHANLGVWTNYQQLDYASSALLTTGPGWALVAPEDQVAIAGATAMVDGADRSVTAQGDTVIGFKQRLYGDNQSRNRFAYWVGLRLPTGHVADPLDSGDISTGDGQTDLGLWFAFDDEPLPDLLLSLHTRHEYQFPGNRDVVDPAAPDGTVSMAYQPGVYHLAELWARYNLPRSGHTLLLGLRTTYEYEGKERRERYDPVSRSYGGSLQAVDGTDSTLWRLQPEIGLNLFSSGIPLATRLYYSTALDGKNSLAADYAGLRVDLYW